MKLLSSADVWRLLHKKYVVVLGDSIQRSVNKGLDHCRMSNQSLQMYKTNMDHLFIWLTEVLSPKCLVICNTSMSVGFKAGEVLEYHIPNVCWDIIEGNFYRVRLADFHQLDVIDVHFHLHFDLRSRVKNATHSNQLAHRKYTCILMAHIDQAWAVQQEEQEEALRRSVDSIGNWHPELGTGQAASVTA
uniref:Uncharacterized protein n=1 Tax=Pyxicephalus adspersus TaxID=30357 RepID=A0AAV3A1U0_PYXAD|nr:TPA: hypothetical protein GDO54_017744 [Pyxicephalus adspersus]